MLFTFPVPLVLLGSSQFIFVGLGVSAWFPGSLVPGRFSFTIKFALRAAAVVKYFTYF